MIAKNSFARWLMVGAILCPLTQTLPTNVACGQGPGQDFVRLQGRHISLTTDLPRSEELDVLVASFDTAVSQWAKFWDASPDVFNDWRLEAFLMKDERRFRQADLIDPRAPDFPYGFAIGNKAWVRVQPSPYYTRHLLLHEGVHSSMFYLFGDAGPTWFREGTAEYLATHSGTGDQIRVGVVPPNRESFAYWGRFKRMKQIRTTGKLPSVQDVIAYAPDLRGDVEAYGWSWALVSLMSHYPEYRPTLRMAADHGRDRDDVFNEWFSGRLSGQWPVLSARWRNLIADFDYGFDWTAEPIEISQPEPTWDGQPITVQIDPVRSWQSIGVQITAGTTLQLQAAGKVILDDQPRDWVSFPPGVTIEYAGGRPLGQLLARLVPIDPAADIQTVSVGQSRTIQVDQKGWLLLKVNDALNKRRDNQGGYQVRVLPKQ